MICTSIAGLGAERCMELVASLPMAEIRLDSVDLTVEDVVRIFSSHPNLVATFRPKDGLDISRRVEFLEKAMASGAAYIDLQLQWPPDPMRHLVELAQQTGCKVIISHHDFELTPSRDELLRIRESCFEAGADLVKLACMVKDPADSARLLGLLGDASSSTLVVGMGPLGVITRLVAPLLGAPFTYASLERGKETAPGQLDTERLNQWIEAMENLAEG